MPSPNLDENMVSQKWDEGYIGGMGLYSWDRGKIYRFRGKIWAKQVGWLFFLSLSYIKNLVKISVQNSSGGMVGWKITSPSCTRQIWMTNFDKTKILNNTITRTNLDEN